jgi:hypothetical protein
VALFVAFICGQLLHNALRLVNGLHQVGVGVLG